MKRMICRSSLLSLLSLLLPAMVACNSTEDAPTYNGHMKMYGHTFPFAKAILWQMPSNEVYATDTFDYEVPMELYGSKYTLKNVIKVSDDVLRFGNQVIALYAEGLSHIEASQNLQGKGAMMTIHLSPEGPQLKSGTYKFSEKPLPGTFRAYVTSEYNSLGYAQNIADVTDGTVTVEMINESQLKVEYHMTRSIGTTIDGSYEGEYASMVQHDRIKEFKDIKLDGQRKREVVTKVPIYSPEDVQKDIEVWDQLARCYLILGSGEPLPVGYLYNRLYMPDIRLCWDDAKQLFYFSAPYARPDFNDKAPKYDALTVTYYAKAPSDFTREDYDNLTRQMIPDDFKSERLDIKPGETSFVFFRNARGVCGCIRIHGYIPSKPYETLVQYGTVRQSGISAPSLMLDYKYIQITAVPKLL